VGSKKKKKRPGREEDPLAVYRRIRTPMPPPEKVVPDKRREIGQEQARREIEEEAGRVTANESPPRPEEEVAPRSEEER
jgi:hypothetical protein